MKIQTVISFLFLIGIHMPLAANPMWTEMFTEQLDEAEAGDIDARYEVGVMYLKGQGVEQNRNKALMWLRRAADEGHSGAARKISRMQEQEAKFEQLSVDAKAGSLQAQYELAMMFLKGRGVAQNGKRARKWLTRAADQGDAKAITRLGILNYKGEGGEQDYAKALALFKQARYQSPLAQYYLGEAYANGAGIEQDRKKAIDWYRKAADSGFDHALGKIINLEEEIKMAQRRKLNVATAEPEAAEKPATPKPAKKTAQPAAKAKKRVVKKSVAKKPAPSPLARLAQNQWQRGSRAVNFLPSKVTQCELEDKKLVCLSEVLERTSGTQIVQYRVKSVVVNKKGTFVISYKNLVLDVTETEESEDQPLGYDDEVEYGYKIQTGWTQAHSVSCSSKSATDLRCVKNKTHKITLVAGR